MAESVLVAVAHPDDEVLGVGGTILRHVKAGDVVTVHIECVVGLRDGQARIEAARRLADTNGYRLSLGESSEGDGRSANFDRLTADVIYTHHAGDLNQDHRAVAVAALVAGRFARSIRTFETVSSTEWGVAPFTPNLYGAIDWPAKILMLREYEGEMRDPPHPRSWPVLDALSRFRGSAVGVEYAEAFMVLRELTRG
jgi:LmbE family N-acetylglucosaminyl deacetylase